MDWNVRGVGMFIGFEQAKRVVNGICERGVLISAAGPLENIQKIRPLLAFEHLHADLLSAALDEALQALA